MMALVITLSAVKLWSQATLEGLNWASDDTLRRITGELGNVSNALPDNQSSADSRLLGRLVDASIQVNKYQARGDLTFDDVHCIYAKAEVVLTARKAPQGNRRGKDQSSAPAATKKGSLGACV